MKTPQPTRRSFIQGLLAAPAALLSLAASLPGVAFAAAQTVKMKKEEAVKKLVSLTGSRPADNFAKGLKYVSQSKIKGQNCINCMHYKKGLDLSGKPLKATVEKKTVEIGACNLFGQGEGWVAGPGYCMGWAKATG